jgi:peptidoglycan/LPS O-acetylase OafA/YrhL
VIAGASAGSRSAPMDLSKRSAVRPEIQALRAVAVLTVVVYHLWPAALPGGFSGVDVFFAISGFLITAHLLREVDRHGRPSLLRFWARRARRLLPAALLTLLVCAIATLVLVPHLYWQQFLTEIGASTTFLQNWQLAADAVDYLAADNRPSPVQHFWSLSAEEQFYAVWPILILVAAWTARRRLAIAVVLTTVTGLSLACSVLQTAANPAAAYFATPTRAWEFGLGGLLALAGGRSRLRQGVRTALSWAGLVAIGLAAALYSAATPFPGAAALLPVLGALAVIHAGLPVTRWAPSWLLTTRPAQFLGDVSYSAYLWHWPLLVFAPFAGPGADATATRVIVAVLTVLLAWLTKVLVEDPVRHSRRLRAQPRMTFACGAAASAMIVAVLALGTTHVQAQIRAAQQQTDALVAEHPPCFGAAARDPAHPCENRALRRQVVPAPVAAREELNAPCQNFRRENGVSVCEFGVPAAQATRHVALIGDSHASHWRAPVDAVARERAWHGLSVTRTSCPFSTSTKLTPEPTRSQCTRWVKALPGFFALHPEIDTVFVSGITGGRVKVPRGRSKREAKVNGYRDAWRTLPATVKHIVVIRDSPKIFHSTLECIDRAIAAHRDAGATCAVPRRSSLLPDPEAIAARATHSTRLQVVDLTPLLCSPGQCFPVIGGALVYKDLHHFTLVFAQTLAAPFGTAVRRLVRSW